MNGFIGDLLEAKEYALLTFLLEGANDEEKLLSGARLFFVDAATPLLDS